MKLLYFTALLIVQSLTLQVNCDGSCDGGLCLPPLGNLLIGRNDRLSASSTDGIYNITNVVPSNITRGKYWKAIEGVELVSIRLDLESLMFLDSINFEFQHPSDKPKAMTIEKSKDFGESWRSLHYFSDNCQNSFPGIITGYPKNYADLVTQSCSQLDANNSKKLQYKLIPADIDVDMHRRFHFSKITNLRINLTELRDTSGSYKILNMNILGSCSCNGHAVKCVSSEPNDLSTPGKVHSTCECLHNTKGMNCEMCQDLFNDQEWGPGYSDNYQCQKCECNGRATECMFSQHRYDTTNQTSGGVCLSCSYSNGVNCEKCKSFFYHDKSDNSCKPCNCDVNGSYTRLCDQESGQCDCKSGQIGRNCGLDRRTSPPHA